MEKQICENDLKIDEVANALKQLPNDKSPGSDGFTTNFYKFFWPDIKDFLHESFLYSFKNGELTNDQKRGIINLIPKEGKDLVRHLRNWRPLSLLNTDYKILTKTLSNRLQKVLPKLVNEDQVGYIRGRYIGQNIRIIKDIMTYTAKKNLPGYILLIDFEKAFDSIEWPFLIKCLKLYNFGENFIRWVQLLHKNIESCVTNNGYLSQPFNLSRGVRQGCPISALLFILVAEIFAIQIRENRFICGIKHMNEEFRICQLADDTTLFISNMKSVIASVTILHRFAKYSGLKINLEKSTTIPIGSCTNKQINLPKEIKQLCVSHAAFKTLGIWFSYDQKEMTKLNFEKKLASIEKTLQIWSSRRLSLKGKVSIIKTLVIPKIVYALSLIFCPTKILEKLDKILFSFLWDNKTPKIKRETIIANYCDGGLKMTDVFLVHESAKIRFLKRILKSDNMKWTKPTWYLLNIEKHQVNHKTPAYYTEQCKTEFHCQVLKCWQKIKCRPPSSIEEIMNEYIFDNKYISCNGKPLDHKLFKSSTILSDDLRLNSLLDNNGHIQTFQQLKHKFDWKLNIHMYNTLITSIPKLWKQKLKGSPPSMNMQSEIYISRKGHLLSIEYY